MYADFETMRKTVQSKYPNLRCKTTAQIAAIYSSLKERELKELRKLRNERRYHQMTLWEIGLTEAKKED